MRDVSLRQIILAQFTEQRNNCQVCTYMYMSLRMLCFLRTLYFSDSRNIFSFSSLRCLDWGEGVKIVNTEMG